MAMFRRPPKLSSPLRHRHEELQRREAELRERVDELERMIADTSRVTRTGFQSGEHHAEPTQIQTHLQVSIAADEDYSDKSKKPRRPRRLRKQRREGRLVFLVLLATLAAAVIWLLTHLPF